MKIARAYADVLFIQAKFPDDSLHRTKASDSVVRTYGYAGWSDLKLSLDRAALNPDDFRTILDSAQRIIEHRQRPTVPPNKPSTQTKAPAQ
jgi:hypothetical protein